MTDARTDEAPGYRAHLAIYLKGLFMGAADAVPGVSGGTIALIVGVYERLIAALTALDPRAVLLLKRVHTRKGRREFRLALATMDVPFLLILGGGVLTAVAAVSGLMHVAVVEFPVTTYSFFFGLIAASAVVLRDEVRLDTPARITVGVGGFGLAFVVSGITQGTNVPTTLPVLFASGAIAITAMILPGISGSFLLLLLGQYEFMTEVPGRIASGLGSAVSGNLDPLLAPVSVLVAFGAGAVIGLLTVAHVVRYALANYHEATLTFLVALMVGALRAPYIEVSENVGAWTPEVGTVVLVAAGVGGALVLGLDHLTGDLDY